MPFDRPSLQTLLSRAQADIESRLPDADASLRRTVLGVLGRIQAGGLHGLYGYLDFLGLQLMPDTAEAEFMRRWAAIWGVAAKQATPATGTALCTGTIGAVLPEATILRRADEVEYAVLAEVVLASTEATVDVYAINVGAKGNLDAGTSLTLPSPVAGINSVATSNEISGGADAEIDESLRARLLTRIQEPPHGGADFDYSGWALEVSGVTRAWVYPRELGTGTVTLRFMTDSTTETGIPSTESVAAVEEHIEAARPVTAELFVLAPIPVAMNPQININPDTTVVRTAIEAQLRDLLVREAEPGETILLSHLREAVSIAAGENDHDLVSPVANVTHATGEIATLGEITWGAL